MDDTLINYANFAAEMFNPRKIIFYHVMDSYEMPDFLFDDDELDELKKPVDEVIKEELDEKVKNGFSADVEHEVVLESGMTVESIIHYVRKNNVDLSVMGKKIGYVGEGGVVKSVIGLISASVLLISETTQHQINKIMVRTNFEHPSHMAYKMAERLAESADASLEFHHVYKFPYNYYPDQSAANLKLVRKKLEPFLNKEFNKFTKKYKIPEEIPFRYSLDVDGDEAQSLYKYAIKSHCDLLVTGSKIKSKLANIMTDSTSKKLAESGKNIPVLIVKDTKHSIGFLKALFD
jgi:nucleotide-binding universal stress UspA family protein